MDIVEEMRGFEVDHEPDGWPAVKMKQVSALCDEIELLRSENARLRAVIDEANAQDPVGVVEVWNQGCSGQFSTLSGIDKIPHGTKLYARPITAQQSPLEYGGGIPFVPWSKEKEFFESMQQSRRFTDSAGKIHVADDSDVHDEFK